MKSLSKMTVATAVLMAISAATLSAQATDTSSTPSATTAAVRTYDDARHGFDWGWLGLLGLAGLVGLRRGTTTVYNDRTHGTNRP